MGKKFYTIFALAPSPISLVLFGRTASRMTRVVVVVVVLRGGTKTRHIQVDGARLQGRQRRSSKADALSPPSRSAVTFTVASLPPPPTHSSYKREAKKVFATIFNKLCCVPPPPRTNEHTLSIR